MTEVVVWLVSLAVSSSESSPESSESEGRCLLDAGLDCITDVEGVCDVWNAMESDFLPGLIR